MERASRGCVGRRHRPGGGGGEINAGEQPDFTDGADAAVHATARELLATGSLGDDGFKTAESTIGYQRLADVVGVIGHFCTTAMMANVAGAEAPDDAPSRIKA